MLIKAYRAIYKNAFLAGMATCFAISVPVVINEAAADQVSINSSPFVSSLTSDNDITFTVRNGKNGGIYAIPDSQDTYTVNSLTLTKDSTNTSVSLAVNAALAVNGAVTLINNGQTSRDYEKGTTINVGKSLQAQKITLNSGTGLSIHPEGTVKADIDLNSGSYILFRNRTLSTPNSDTIDNGDAVTTATYTIDGNFVNTNSEVEVSVTEKTNSGPIYKANKTLTITGNYTQSGEDSELEVSSRDSSYTSALNVNGNMSISGGEVEIGDALDDLDSGETTGKVSLNVGGNLSVSNSSEFHVADNATVTVNGNAAFSSTITFSDEDKANIAAAYPGLEAHLANNVTGVLDVKGNLAVSGMGLSVYGKQARINVGGSITTSDANSIYVMAGSVFSGTKAAMLNSDATAKNDNIATGTFNVDATSTVEVTGVETSSSDTIKAIRSQLFSTDTGILAFAGATIVDAPKEGEVGFSDAKKYEGTNVLAEKTVSGVNGDITGSHSWGNAVLAAGSNTMSITSGGVTLSKASDSGNFVTTSDGGVGSVNLASGAQLALNGSGAVADITGSGTVKIGNNTKGAVKANSVKVANLTMENGSSLTAASDVTMGEGTIAGGSSISASTITVDGTDSTLNILSGSSLRANTIVLNGNTIFVDPDWTEAASYLYFNSLGSDSSNPTLDGDTVVGQNSGLYLGDTLSESDFKSYLASTLSENGITALAYIDKAFTVGTGYSLTVDGSLTSADAAAKADNTVVIGSSSALIVTGNALANGAAITFATAGTVTNDGQVILKDVDVADGSSYSVFANATVSGSGSYSFSNALFSGSADSSGTVTATYSEDNANTYLSKTDSGIASSVMSYAKNGGSFTGSSFLNQALSLNSTATAAARAAAIGKSLNSAARFSVLAGGIQNAEMALKASSNAVEERLGFGTATVSRLAAIEGTRASIWLQPLFNYQKSNGFDGGKTGDYGVKSKLWGVALGSDVTLGDFVVGGAFNVGKGDSSSRGDYAYTKNDYKFFGLSAYGSYKLDNFLFMADVEYTRVSGDAKQYNDAATLKGDVDTNVFSLGLKGKYTFNTEYVDIAPHVGIRYSYYDVLSDDIKTGSERIRNKGMDASVVSFPVGTAFSKDWAVEDWNFKGVLDLELIAAAGDTDVKSKIVASGVEMSAKSDVVDKLSYSGKLGINIEKNDFGIGLGYQYLGSKNANNHNVYLNARYTF